MKSWLTGLIATETMLLIIVGRKSEWVGIKNGNDIKSIREK